MRGGIPGARGGGSHLLDEFPSVRAVVLGEAMLDIYLRGNVNRLSPEGPFPVVDSPVRESTLGGAANMAANAAALGAGVALVSVVGRDAAGSEIMRLAGRHRVDVAGVSQDLRRRTLTKTRVVGAGTPMVRVDDGSTGPLTAGLRRRMLSHLQRARADVLILSDYRYGVVDDEILAWLADVPARPLTVVDSKDLSRFRSVRPDVVTSNYEETVTLLQLPRRTGVDRVEQVGRYGEAIREATGAVTVAVTLDADGAVVLAPGSDARHVPAVGAPHEPCGAGDTFTAAVALALAAGAEPLEAVALAQRAAAVVVGRAGTAVCSVGDLRDRPETKWCDPDTLMARLAQHREAGQSVVFTNGCFDLLHAGHVASLQEAASQGDVLVVGVNGDAGVTRLKGPGRPINSLADRVAVLAGLATVDYVVSFEEDTPAGLLGLVRPDVYCKGGDYEGRWIPEIDLVQGWNGRVHYTRFVPDRSTSATVDKVRSNGDAGLGAAR